MPVTAIVPLNELSAAKTRLAPALTLSERRLLVAWMLTRVLDACHRARTVASTLVVAGDREAAELARAAGATQVLVQSRPGLPAAIALADETAHRAEATVVVAADLPLVQAADLESVCRAGARAPAVVVVPALDGGTAALLRRPPRVIDSAYGEGSAAAHLALAAAADVPARRFELPRLSVDVDTPAALRRLDLVDGRGALRPLHGLGSRGQQPRPGADADAARHREAL